MPGVILREGLRGLPYPVQAAMRGVKQAAMTQADPDDPLKDQYGDLELVQSKTVATKTYVKVEDLSIDMKGQRVRAES